MAAKVLATMPGRRPTLVLVEFVTQTGDTGEAHLERDMPVALMAVHDFEEEEW